MKTDFKDYLAKNKAQKRIDKLAQKYTGKKVVLYGAGYFANDLLENYDLSKLNIVGVADLKFQNNDKGDFFGYRKIGAYDLPDNDFDVILITTYNDEDVRDFFDDSLFEGIEIKFNVETLIRMGLFTYIKQILSE